MARFDLMDIGWGGWHLGGHVVQNVGLAPYSESHGGRGFHGVPARETQGFEKQRRFFRIHEHLAEFMYLVQQIEACFRHVGVCFCSARESCPSSFYQMTVPFPGINRF